MNSSLTRTTHPQALGRFRPGPPSETEKPLQSRWDFYFWALVFISNTGPTAWRRPFERTKPRASSYGTVWALHIPKARWVVLVGR